MKTRLLAARTLAFAGAAFLLAGLPPAARAEVPPAVSPVNDGAYAGQALALIRSARKSIRAAVFQVRYYPEHPDSPSNLLIDALIEAAGRGLDVQVCVDYSRAPNLGESNAHNLASAQRLTGGGVAVYLADREKTMHAKFLAADEQVILLGSTNWSYYSLDRNREVNLLARCPDTTRQFFAYFETLKKEARFLAPPGSRPGPADAAGRPAAGATVNPNTASPGELTALPGIGPALAERIIERRQAGRFNRPEDLLEVSGIGPTTLARFRGMLRFD